MGASCRNRSFILPFSELASGQVLEWGLGALPAQDAAELDLISLSDELESAKLIQQSLLPQAFPDLQGFELAGFCQSARHVGGDFYDVVPFAQGGALLVVADVMGKGVPAAMFASTLRTLIRTIVPWTQNPAEILSRVNHALFEQLSSVEMFITAQLAVMNPMVGVLAVASAGHLPLLLSDGHELRSVSPRGLPLGISAAAVYQETRLNLTRGSSLLLYTDGLVEARDPQGHCFGQPALERFLLDIAGSTLDASQLKEKLSSELKSFRCGGPITDDQTFLLVTSHRCETVASPFLEAA